MPFSSTSPPFYPWDSVRPPESLPGSLHPPRPVHFIARLPVGPCAEHGCAAKRFPAPGRIAPTVVAAKYCRRGCFRCRRRLWCGGVHAAVLQGGAADLLGQVFSALSEFEADRQKQNILLCVPTLLCSWVGISYAASV